MNTKPKRYVIHRKHEMPMEELVHGPKEFAVTLQYKELAQPITETFYTRIELEAFLKGIEIASHYMGAPTLIHKVFP